MKNYLKNTQKNKVISYLGFAKKSGDFICGVDDIVKAKHPRVIVISEELAESGRKKTINYAEKYKIKWFEVNGEEMSELAGNFNIKAFAVKNINLADAIIKIFAENFSNGGNLE